jgi:hypothetical protein
MQSASFEEFYRMVQDTWENKPPQPRDLPEEVLRLHRSLGELSGNVATLLHRAKRPDIEEVLRPLGRGSDHLRHECIECMGDILWMWINVCSAMKVSPYEVLGRMMKGAK